jgi:Putative peptidoglycan binding domain
MKTFLLLAVSLSIALTGIVKAENQDEVKQPKNRSKSTQNARPVTPVGPRISPKAAQTYHQKVQPTARTYTPPVMPKTNMPRTYTKTPADTSVRNKNWEKKNWQNNYSQNNSYKPTPQKKNWQNSNNPNTTLPNRNWHTNNNQNTTVQKKNWHTNNNQNTTVQKKNWQNHNNTWNNNSWADARRRHHRDHHDRNWWRSRYSRFALFGSGFYFWDGGYWFPAYGYDPGYNSYSYDEPIYGYNDLDPAQVIANVQTELQRLGYYRYAVDGTMGPATRAAIANYQRDTGLSITAAIDGPTLQSLGLG